MHSPKVLNGYSPKNSDLFLDTLTRVLINLGPSQFRFDQQMHGSLLFEPRIFAKLSRVFAFVISNDSTDPRGPALASQPDFTWIDLWATGLFLKATHLYKKTFLKEHAPPSHEELKASLLALYMQLRGQLPIVIQDQLVNGESLIEIERKRLSAQIGHIGPRQAEVFSSTTTRLLLPDMNLHLKEIGRRFELGQRTSCGLAFGN